MSAKALAEPTAHMKERALAPVLNSP